MLFAVVTVAGLSLTAVAEGERADVAGLLDGISQISLWSARMYYQRGQRLYYGRGCDRDLPAAVEAFRKAAEMGYANAEYMLGTCYHNGYGVGQDMKQAVEWCERAAIHGHAQAMFEMGLYRHSGMGGVVNAAEACYWFRMAAQHGVGNPNFDSGLDESEDCGLAASLAWIVNKAESGDTDAIYWYSCCFAYGWGVPRDDAAALELLIDAASLGHSLAKCMIGREMWYGRLPGGQDEGLELVIKAAEEGDTTAYLYLEKLEQTGQM